MVTTGEMEEKIKQCNCYEKFKIHSQFNLHVCDDLFVQ